MDTQEHNSTERKYVIKISNNKVELDKNMTLADMRKVMIFIYEFFKVLKD